MKLKPDIAAFARGKTRLFLVLQAAALLGGNIVGWTTISKEVDRFCGAQGGGFWQLTAFTGTAIKNPLLTPCFWGSVVFLISLAWTISLLMEKDTARLARQLNMLWWLLAAGVLFALANNILPIYRHYTRPAGGLISCSGNLVTNPYLTSCFLGFSAFLLAFIFASLAKTSSQNPEKS